jgi:uncharacterized membrane protein
MVSRVRCVEGTAHNRCAALLLVLFTASLVSDVFFLSTGRPAFAGMAFWVIGLAAVFCALNAMLGLLDWLATPAGTHAKVVGLWDCVGYTLISVLLVLSWILRRPVPKTPGHTAIAVSMIAVSMVLLVEWLERDVANRLDRDDDAEVHLHP